ncbi:DUF2716 domain-containing protein [Microtetraspora sp. NBRC 16547]|uniref:DUF2716 domain-containing protein n=1 Tax=Microtetraspora sp. NBRC 16547 TaxID=3030993 RepID=UPI00249FE8AF|nr:DUF2716 domain-containing protein [Microtetraspora sp. NBRC 16547]GLW98860.1 hypothetical protein Misp02_29470 [Microtetraspora sp. NBRC 16547]
MSSDGYVECGVSEYRDICNRFVEAFVFRPSYDWQGWPSIREPSPSVTWGLSAILLDPVEDAPEGKKLDQLGAVIQRGLAACALPEMWLYSVDWYHSAVRFRPDPVGGLGQPRWPGSAFPDGDYYVYFSEDFSFGTFGHPWEGTLCVFGAGLLAQVTEDLTAVLGNPRRRDGRGL